VGTLRANGVNVPFRDGLSYHLYTFADMHVGNAACVRDKLEAHVRKAANDPLALVTINGDAGDFITYTDRRFDPSTVDGTLFPDVADLKRLPDIYIDYLTELFLPVRDKIVCITTGKHDGDVEKLFRKNPLWELCENLNKTSVWGDWACMTTLHFTDGNKHSDSFDVFQSHGWQAGRKGGAMVNNLDDMMGWILCDLLLQSHSHQYLVKHKVVLYAENGKIKQKVCVGAHTGGWLLTYQQVEGHDKTTASYAEKAGYPPTMIGSPVFTFTPNAYGHGEVTGG
jgi:hypothetical protein